MLMNKNNYPTEWKWISDNIRFIRAKSRCECESECGLHTTTGRCKERHGKSAKWAKGKVVLTVAHLCHESSCDNFKHLKAMCQRCHLRLDSKQHALNASKTRNRKKGQMEITF